MLSSPLNISLGCILILLATCIVSKSYLTYFCAIFGALVIMIIKILLLIKASLATAEV